MATAAELVGEQDGSKLTTLSPSCKAAIGGALRASKHFAGDAIFGNRESSAPGLILSATNGGG